MEKRYALRLILNGQAPEIGSALPNSWHPADACDWLTEDQELPGSCGFLMADDSAAAEAEAWAWAKCYWPECESAVIISGTLVAPAEYGGLPEDGAAVLAGAIVVREAERKI